MTEPEKASNEIPLAACVGCRDDVYNYNNPRGGRCWHAARGKIVTRYRIATWTAPTEPGAFTEVVVPSCRTEKGEHFREELPDFVRAEDVVRATTAKP